MIYLRFPPSYPRLVPALLNQSCTLLQVQEEGSGDPFLHQSCTAAFLQQVGYTSIFS